MSNNFRRFGGKNRFATNELLNNNIVQTNHLIANKNAFLGKFSVITSKGTR